MLRAVVCLPENITFLATRNRATMPSLGKIEEFNSATTSINRYLERLEQYFVANNVPADSEESHKRRAILICYWRQGLRCSFGSLLTDSSLWENVRTAHHYPKESFRTEIAERYRFHNCTQREGESVTAFAANLKHLASTCQFDTQQALRDRFICGLRSKQTLKKLLTEEHTFDAALEVALGAEAAEKDVAAFSQEGSASVNKVDSGNRRSFQPTQHRKGSGKRGKFSSSGSNIKDPSECVTCGKTGHPRSQCKFRNYTCHSCG